MLDELSNLEVQNRVPKNHRGRDAMGFLFGADN
jgi:hypothetical protein